MIDSSKSFSEGSKMGRESRAEKPNFQAALFDMDGVLVDSEDLIARAASTMFREWYGVEVPREAFLPYVGAGENRYIGDVARDFGIEGFDLPAAKVRTYQHYDEFASNFLKVLPGAMEYPLACRRDGLKIALASAADYAKVAINLRVLGISADFFDAIITGSEIERKKPFPDIYLLAASRVGADPARCLVIEDAVNGILAGVAAGSSCLGLTTSFDEKELKAAGARWCARDLGAAPLPNLLP
jgi:beta-phosphoglucomutase